jgi:hypothetical protein
MGFVDNRLILSSNQSVVSAGIVESSSTIDLQALRNVGQGEPLYVRFTVTEAFTALAGSPKLTTMTHTASAGGTNWYLTSGIETHYITGGVDLALAGSVYVPAGMQSAYLTLGRTWFMPVSPMNAFNTSYPLGQRYFGVTYWQWGYIGSALASVVFTGSGSATITKASHGMSNGYRVLFTTVPAGGELSTGVYYYVVNAATNTFEVSETSGGSAITVAAASGLTHNLTYYGQAFATGKVSADIVDSTHLPKIHYPIGYSE